MVKEPTKVKEPTEFEDSIIAGILGADKDCIEEVIPKKDVEKKKVVYLVYGDVEKALQKIYSNQPLGSLDVLRSIKSTRSAIFNLKGGQR